jgi:hypothetical protein
MWREHRCAFLPNQSKLNWNPEFLKGAVTGSDGKILNTGWSNTTIFNNYVTKHFAKYNNISKSDSTLLLYDGHQSHINLTLTDVRTVLSNG